MKSTFTSHNALTIPSASPTKQSLKTQLVEANETILKLVKEKDRAWVSRAKAVFHYESRQTKLDKARKDLKEANDEQERLRQVNEDLNGENATLKTELNKTEQRAKDPKLEDLISDNATLKMELNKANESVKDSKEETEASWNEYDLLEANT